jgi:cobalt-zinc-cadmium efflux system membrane fusion protein
MPINRLLAVLLLSTILLPIACKQKGKQGTWITDEAGNRLSLVLSQEQIAHAGITFLPAGKHPDEQYVTCPGYLGIPPGNVFQVSVPAGGILKTIAVFQGKYAEAGTVLATLESMAYIELQQEYLETKSRYDYFHQEFERQGELTMENASSVKKMQLAQRDYLAVEIKLGSLKAQLALLGIPADSIDMDNLSAEIEIKAPVNGTITEIHASPGIFMKPGDGLFEISGNRNLNITLTVPERHFPLLHNGQEILFSLPYDSLSAYEARISRISEKIDPASKTFYAIAAISKGPVNLAPGLSVKARILAGVDTLTVVPSEAVVHEQTGTHLYIMNNGVFSPVEVEIIRNEGDNTLIRGNSPAAVSDSIVITGSDFLNAIFSE